MPDRPKPDRSKPSKNRAYPLAPTPGPDAQAVKLGAPPAVDPTITKAPWLSDWSDRLFHLLSKYFGKTAALVLVALAMVAGSFAWTTWKEIREWRAVSDTFDWIKQPNLPKAKIGEFTVVVAKLESDKDGEFENYIVQSLVETQAIRVLRLGRRIYFDDPDPREAETHARNTAKGFLDRTAANILLYGAVIDVSGQRVPKLFWAVSEVTSDRVRQGRYSPAESNQLPPLFWDDLSDVLRLIVLTQANAFEGRASRFFVADKVDPFVARVRLLLADNARITARWKREDVAAVRTKFANALAILGGQGGVNDRLVEAVAVYEDLQKEFTREHVPLIWAQTQYGLGIALAMLGEREGGTVRLEQAVAVFQELLKVLSRERMSLDCACAQNALGGTLTQLGIRESGTARLEQARAIFQETLKELTRERVPLDWAHTQQNLGFVLLALGERERSTARLEEAVGIFQEALKELARERVPRAWANAQHDLGSALAELGVIENSTARLEQAAGIFQEALKERTRERFPLEWAITQNNLGQTLAELGTQESGTARLEKAIRIFQETLKERSRERVPLDWARTQHNLAGALFELGIRERNTVRLEQAVAFFQEALKEITRERVPREWMKTQISLGGTLVALGVRESGTTHLEQGVTILEERLKELDGIQDNQAYPGARTVLERAKLELRKRPKTICCKRSQK